jgi:coupling of ubiquitin conjugation to ER degradation protein 1
MDSQTVTLILGVVVLLVVVNFFFVEDNNGSRSRSNRNRVTTDMVDAVQAVAPTLSIAQIRADLAITGSVQTTVERYLAGNIQDIDTSVTSGVTSGTNVTNSNTIPKVSMNTKGNNFDDVSFDEKKRQIILENRRKLQFKRGVVFV